jgi:hypothetical protein
MDEHYGVLIKQPKQDDDTEPQLYETEYASLQQIEMTPLLMDRIKSVLSYMDKLLEDLPESKITEFANSDFFKTYKNLFNELGLV